MDFDQEIVLGFCDEADDLINRWEALCLELSKSADDGRLGELFRIAHNIKGGSRAVGLNELGDFIHKIEDGITLIREGKVGFSVKINSLLLETQKLLSDWISSVRKDFSFAPDWKPLVNRYKAAFQGEGSSVTIAAIPSETSKDFPKSTEPDVAAPQVVEREQKEKPVVAAKVASQPAATGHETVRVSAQKLDQLLQAIGELSIHQSIIWHARNHFSSAGKMITHSVQLSQKLTKELYDRALSLRMQPIQSLFQRLERNVMELSTSLGKEVDVAVVGGDVELDKTVMEKIVDPMTHIVRNAIDHGVETAEARIATGKSARGLITISATQDAGSIEIRVSDDGKGLRADKLLQKAQEKQLISADAELTENEIFQLIFLPGFSTAEKVTDVSGRGVGMDVVKRALEELQGTIRIESEVGKGTSFNISLPTSVSIVDAMIFGLCGQKYVVPVTELDEVIDLTSSIELGEQKMFSLRGQIVPIIGLNNYLSHKRDPKSKFQTLFICKRGTKRIGLLADEVFGEQQIVVRPLNENISGAFGLLGGTILSNGEPGIIVDVPAIADRYLKEISNEGVAA